MQAAPRISWWRAAGGAILLAALLAVAARWHAPRSADRDVATNGDAGTVQQLLVTLADEQSVDEAAVDAWSSAVGVPFDGAVHVWGAHHVVRLRAPVDAARAEQIAARLRQVAGILAADADRRIWPQAVPNDPRFAEQWHLYEAAGGINAPDAWDVTTGAADVVVAVLDTGIRPAHPDLAGRLLAGRDFVSSTTFSNDGDGRDADPTDPGNFSVAGECGASSAARVSTWHGTHVAGIIGAATDNGTGVAGIAWQARILPVRTSGKCGGVVSDLIEAIRWSAGLTVVGSPTNPNPAKVINMSLSSPGACPVQLQAAINAARAAGAVLVTGAGNEGADASSASPANCTGVITVGATTRAGDRAPYSSFGTRVDVSAPGGYSSAADSILSTWNDGTATPGNETYGALQGTSFASAQVAGVAALVRSANSRIDAAKVASVIAASARAFPGGSDCSTSTCGRGIVDATAAVRAVVTPPVVSAGADRVVDVGAGVSLQGSATDDGSVVSLAWEQTGGPAVALTGATTASPTFTAPAESATLVFRLTATDDVTLTAADSVTISVVRPNRPPSPTSPPLVTDEDTAGSVQVAANEPDGDAVTYSIAGAPSSGTASVDATGRVSYVPPAHYFGTTSLVVEVSDAAGAAAQLSIPITVRPVNDAPTASSVAATLAEDGTIVIALAGADVDGDALTYAIATGPARGTATIVDASAGTVRYVPAADASGPDEFTYVARDASATSAPARVAITVTAVNDVPVALARTLSATEDQTATASLAATDADGDALTFAIATPPTKGTVTITDAATGAYRYVPSRDANGADSFTFVARDAVATSAPATVTIDVAAVNDAPVATAGTLAATEDVAADGVLVATDVDGGALAFRIVTPPTRGTVVLLDAATGAYRYTPAPNANGADSFTFAARDAEVESAPATVSITIAAVDDPPVAQSFELAGDEDVPVADSLRGSDAAATRSRTRSARCRRAGPSYC